MPSEVRVNLGPRSYSILIEHSIAQDAGMLIRKVVPSAARAVIVHDAALPASALEQVAGSMKAAGFACTLAPAVATEEHKSLDAAGKILELVANAKLERDEPVVALGGGVIGDLAGFVAGTYRRGVPFVNIPTTLLAMVDAAAGGKTGVNLLAGGRLLKNMVGVFHQPRLVLADPNMLASLSARQLRAGAAECIKHAMIAAEFGDPTLLDDTEAGLERLLTFDPGLTTDLIARNIAIKARVVGEDEHETASVGGRVLLNLGHTFGHAIETMPQLSPDSDPSHAPLLHGEAIALGLVAACRTARELKLVDASYEARIRELLVKAGLPTRVAGLPQASDVAARMMDDKKVQGGKLRLILPLGPGRAIVRDDVPQSAILAGIAAMGG